MGLDDHYAAAVARLRAVGVDSVADRLERRGRDLDHPAMCVAIMAAVDAVDCRRAAALDPTRAVQWNAIGQDQAQLSRSALAPKGVEVER